MGGGGYGCTEESNRFNAPLPWIGIYIAAASSICFVGISLDTLDGLRHRRLWFPCRLFPINSTSLTLLSIATKLPLDLSSPMPAPQDQLTKLTGTILICIVMAFSMPSFAVMQDAEILSNLAALFIFVVTVVGNVCTQLATGVIYSFTAEHIVILICMLLLLGLICSSALVVDTTNTILNNQYDCKAPTRLQRAQMEYIKSDAGKVWLMAHTSSPQYVMARSVMSTAAGALTCLCVLILIQAEIRCIFTHFCAGQSDYKWANWPVVVSQTMTVLVGSVAPALRWFNATGYRKSGALKNCREEFGVEIFWVQRLEEWKEDPLPVYSHFLNRSLRKRPHLLRNAVLDICISLQKIALQLSANWNLNMGLHTRTLRLCQSKSAKRTKQPLDLLIAFCFCSISIFYQPLLKMHKKSHFYVRHGIGTFFMIQGALPSCCSSDRLSNVQTSFSCLREVNYC